MSVKLKTLGDRVLVEPIEEKEQTKNGIIIPDSAKEKPQEGKVVVVGSGKLNEKGERVPFEVKEGDRVLYSKYGGTEVTVDNNRYLIMREDDILAVLKS